MKKEQKHYALDLAAYKDAGEDLKNRMLLYWLSDDELRGQLFEEVNSREAGMLKFPSRDAAPRECDQAGYEKQRPPAEPRHKWVTLVTSRERITEILENRHQKYSSRVYAELGGGNFMLALDPWNGTAHAEQVDAFRQAFHYNASQLQLLAAAACQAAGVLAFRAPDFDLATFAEQAALRYCQLMMGYAVQDFPLLEAALRAGYEGLVYQVHGRHFVTDPTAIPQARMAMGRLLARTSALIDAYAAEDRDALKGCTDPALPPGIVPALKRLGGLPVPGDLNGAQRAIVAVGAAVGSVGNIQAAVCIAVKGLYKKLSGDGLAQVRAWAQGQPTWSHEYWQGLVADLLRENPPIPFLPRIRVATQERREGKAKGEELEEYLLALGGGTRTSGLPAGGDDPLVWGLPPEAKHNCAGQALAWPLIVELVRTVMGLPGLAQGLDPRDAAPAGLDKRRGFQCLSYPFTHRRDRWRAQTTLNVAMRIRAPVKDNADHVREVIRAGAPRVEVLLRKARHVHFAWFELIEADTVLVLHTVYDGPFGAYLQHFALDAGDLFDLLFQYIEDPPPMPVARFPDEFAAHLLRYNRQPLMGYFFSAYPRSEVARIVRDELRGR